jgi:hypothetical protein
MSAMVRAPDDDDTTVVWSDPYNFNGRDADMLHVFVSRAYIWRLHA